MALTLDAGSVSVIAATVVLGPPQASPVAIAVLGSNLSEILLLLAVGHLGSALLLFLLFQAISPLIDRMRAWFGSIRLRVRRGEAQAGGRRTSLSFGVISPGRKYFFMGAVVFVFAFGSFLGVAATQAVGMRRSRAFAAVMLGCALSVFFWGLTAFYLSKAIDPVCLTLIFVMVAVAFIWRGRILENRFVEELRSLGSEGIKVLSLVAEGLTAGKIAALAQLRLEETAAILQQLCETGYVVSTGKEIYKMTERGLEELGSIPDWLLAYLRTRRLGAKE